MTWDSLRSWLRRHTTWTARVIVWTAIPWALLFPHRAVTMTVLFLAAAAHLYEQRRGGDTRRLGPGIVAAGVVLVVQEAAGPWSRPYTEYPSDDPGAMLELDILTVVAEILAFSVVGAVLMVLRGREEGADSRTRI